LSSAALIWSVFADEESAAAAADRLLEDGLIACANIMPGVRSIYRWRGGRLELLLAEVQQQIHPDFIEEKALATNFRSLPGIIQFNNALFECLPELMQEGMNTSYQIDAENLLVEAFKGVGQSIPSGKMGLEFQGKIRLEFTQKTSSRSTEEADEEEEDDCALGRVARHFNAS